MDELRRQQWLTQALGGRKGKVVCGKSSLVWLILPPSSSSAAADIGPEPKEGIHVVFVFHPKTPPKVSILTCHLISWKLYSCITMKKSARMKLYQDYTENHLVSFKYLFFKIYISIQHFLPCFNILVIVFQESLKEMNLHCNSAVISSRFYWQSRTIFIWVTTKFNLLNGL